MDSSKEAKILVAAHGAFLRHGFKRITMQEIAEAAGVSRPALYLVYRSKEEVFSEVIRRNMELSCEAIVRELESVDGGGAKVRRALDLWAVKTFEQIQASPEARELLESGHEFARESFEEGYRRFESILAEHLPPDREVRPAEAAHLLTSAVRGFKQVAGDAAELEALIGRLLLFCGLG